MKNPTKTIIVSIKNARTKKSVKQNFILLFILLLVCPFTSKQKIKLKLKNTKIHAKPNFSQFIFHFVILFFFFLLSSFQYRINESFPTFYFRSVHIILYIFSIKFCVCFVSFSLRSRIIMNFVCPSLFFVYVFVVSLSY